MYHANVNVNLMVENTMKKHVQENMCVKKIDYIWNSSK